MNTMVAFSPALAVGIGILAAVLIGVSGRRPNLRETWTILASIGMFVLVLCTSKIVLAGRSVPVMLWFISPELHLAFRVDALGFGFAVVASGLWILTSWYSIGYLRTLKLPNQTRYFSAFALAMGATIGLAFAQNLLTFVIFYELLTLATYPLVAHKGTPEARRAGRTYLVYTLSGGAALLFATAWTYHLAGRLDFLNLGLLREQAPTQELVWLFGLFAVGFAVKSALMPFHSWLPIAMIAPTPVSALLHAVAVVKAGVFGYLRLIQHVFGPELMRELGVWQPLAWMAAATILGASLIALTQDNLKRRLAYSTIGHLSYIVLGAALLVPSGYTGSVFHLANHAFMKITLFFCAGAIYVTTHHERISELRGLGWRMPWTFGAFTIAALGLSGLPLLCGFISKWWLCRGALEAGQPLLMGVLLLSGVLNAAYLLPIVTRAFDPSARRAGGIREAPLSMRIPLVTTACLTLAFGLIPSWIAIQHRLAWLTARLL